MLQTAGTWAENLIRTHYGDLLAAPESWSAGCTVDLLILVMVVSGISGFLYEELFYLIDLGRLVKRGSTYGPWIPIYMFGGLFILLITCRFRARPWLVFLLGVIISGVLEYATGAVLYEVFHTRLWDYNTEIWNWGNIGGYVCLRSVLLFGLAGVFLIYIVAPLLIRLVAQFSRAAMHTFCCALIGIWLADMGIWKWRH